MVGALNKMTKLQQFLVPTYASKWLLACSTYATTFLPQPPHRTVRKHLRQLSRPQTETPTIAQISEFTIRQLNTKFSKVNFSSTRNSDTIDDFRAREEQREKAFEQQGKQDTNEETEKKRNAEKKIDAVRMQILEAAMPHVPTHGWTRNAIIQGAEDAGYPSAVHGMFPDGGYALVSYFYGKCNEDLVKFLQAETQQGNREVTDPAQFLTRAIRTRLEMIAPYKGQWPQALALMALPQNAPTALAQLLTLVDDICYYSGDRSVDLGWYTRRIGVATIMKITELYMLRDESPNHIDSWNFLDNRMDEAVQVQAMLSQTEDMTHNVQRSFNSAFITARNMLGLNYSRR